jgi:hypothetical protein
MLNKQIVWNDDDDDDDDDDVDNLLFHKHEEI